MSLFLFMCHCSYCLYVSLPFFLLLCFSSINLFQRSLCFVTVYLSCLGVSVFSFSLCVYLTSINLSVHSIPLLFLSLFLSLVTLIRLYLLSSPLPLFRLSLPIYLPLLDPSLFYLLISLTSLYPASASLVILFCLSFTSFFPSLYLSLW